MLFCLKYRQNKLFVFQKAIMDTGSEWAQNKKVVDLSKKDIRSAVSCLFPSAARVHCPCKHKFLSAHLWRYIFHAILVVL